MNGVAASEQDSRPESVSVKSIVSARNIVKRVADGSRQVTLLDRVSVEIAAGEFVALLGPSGSGKSTLLNILGALEPDFEGEVQIGGEHLARLGDRELARFRNRTLGFVFQAYNLLGHLSAIDNVLLPARFADEELDRQRGRDVLAEVGLADKAARLPATLSGGERQRVAIARALYHRPKLVLCDEPTGNLDKETGAEVLKLFAGLSTSGVTLLIATHDEAIAAAAHRVLKLRGGRLA
jgi:putative ABC transport system ATP-binding protein